MLPFLKPKANSGLIVQKRSAIEPKEESNEIQDLEGYIEQFKQALEANDLKKMASIIKSAHNLLHEHMDQPESEEQDQE